MITLEPAQLPISAMRPRVRKQHFVPKDTSMTMSHNLKTNSNYNNPASIF